MLTRGVPNCHHERLPHPPVTHRLYGCGSHRRPPSLTHQARLCAPRLTESAAHRTGRTSASGSGTAEFLAPKRSSLAEAREGRQLLHQTSRAEARSGSQGAGGCRGCPRPLRRAADAGVPVGADRGDRTCPHRRIGLESRSTDLLYGASLRVPSWGRRYLLAGEAPHGDHYRRASHRIDGE